MNLEQILAELSGLENQDERRARITELMQSDGFNAEEVHAAAVEAAQEWVDVDVDSMSDEQIAQAEVLSDVLDTIAESLTADEVAEIEAEAAAEREAAEDNDSETASAQQRKERAAEAAASLKKSAATKIQPKAEAADEAKAASESVPLNNTQPDQASQPEQQEPERELVAASATTDQNGSADMNKKKVPLGSGGGETKQLEDNRHIKHTVVAAGDLPNYRAGQELDTLGQLAAAVHTGMSLVSRSQAPGVRQSLASIRREVPDHLMYTKESDWVKVDAVTDQRKLPGGSLTAAGGWCAPSEVMYDSCPIPVSRDGMIDIPTITATRGGIKYTARPDLAQFWGAVGFVQTETDAIAGVQKPCWDIPCPDDLLECRMDLEGICLRQSLLTERGWPEKVEEFLEYAMLAHAHWINARRIQRMVDLATYSVEIPAAPAPEPDAVLDPHGPGAFETVLSVLELQVEYFRYSMRLSRSAMLEGMAPYWLRGILRADISKKLGIENRWGAAANAALDRWFADRGVRIQFVYDWQDSMSEQDDSYFGGSVPTAWPEQVSILLWEPGTYFGLQQDVINLTGIFDSVGLENNVYTRLFTEEGFQVCARCGRSMLITFNLCPNGLSGSHQRTMCLVDNGDDNGNGDG